jgi:hypothetical protein
MGISRTNGKSTYIRTKSCVSFPSTPIFRNIYCPTKFNEIHSRSPQKSSSDFP